MAIYTIITMIIVLGIVLGGLGIFLFKAVKFEKFKTQNGKE